MHFLNCGMYDDFSRINMDYLILKPSLEKNSSLSIQPIARGEKGRFISFPRVQK